MSTNSPTEAAVAAAPPVRPRPRDSTRPSLTEALRLRRNLLSSLWIGIRQLPRGRRVILLIRIGVSAAQILAFIPVLALPSSHQISPSAQEGRVCNPDSLFKYLVVHVVRLSLNIPVEIYLGLSPHRTRQARRAGPEARAIAERDRPLGSEYLDRKIGKISDLLGIASLVIFFLGNAIVYSSTECSQSPAEARPLFWAALSSLIVIYFVIVEVALLAFLIVCALPLLIVILRALGLQHRLPQRQIRPETGKIDQEEVDKRLKLVYYTPAEEEEEDVAAPNEQERVPTNQDSDQDAQTQGADVSSSRLALASPASERPDLGSRRTSSHDVVTAEPPAHSSFTRLARILFARQRRRRNVSSDDGENKKQSKAKGQGVSNTTPSQEGRPSTVPATSTGGFKYPLHPLPAHRATCPICLCDFEEPQLGQEPEPEPLRLLQCGHVMHKSCVDQWLTTVSGRCPVCQRAVIPEHDQVGPSPEEPDLEAQNQAPPRVVDVSAAEPPPPQISSETPPTSTPIAGADNEYEMHVLPEPVATEEVQGNSESQASSSTDAPTSSVSTSTDAVKLDIADEHPSSQPQ